MKIFLFLLFLTSAVYSFSFESSLSFSNGYNSDIFSNSLESSSLINQKKDDFFSTIDLDSTLYFSDSLSLNYFFSTTTFIENKTLFSIANSIELDKEVEYENFSFLFSLLSTISSGDSDLTDNLFKINNKYYSFGALFDSLFFFNDYFTQFSLVSVEIFNGLSDEMKYLKGPSFLFETGLLYNFLKDKSFISSSLGVVASFFDFDDYFEVVEISNKNIAPYFRLKTAFYLNNFILSSFVKYSYIYFLDENSVVYLKNLEQDKKRRIDQKIVFSFKIDYSFSKKLSFGTFYKYQRLFSNYQKTNLIDFEYSLFVLGGEISLNF